jgi:putative spermidine/putrescine transport system permease protein
MSTTVSPPIVQRSIAEGSRSLPWLLLAPALVFILVAFVVPLAYMIWLSVTDPVVSIGNYVALVSEPFYSKVLWRTFFTALIVSVGCLILAYPVALYAVKAKNWLGNAILIAAGLSFWISFIVRTYAWMVILGNSGPIAGLIEALGFTPAPRILFTSTASIIGLIHILIPYMILSIYSVVNRIDPNLERAAVSMGASRWHAFTHVYLPLSLPGVVNGCLLTFVFCIGFYVAPALLGGPADQLVGGIIALQINDLLEWGMASALAVLLMAVTFVILLIYDRFVGLDRLWG